MRDEIEVKFFPVDKDWARESLSEMGATLVTPEVLMRRVVFNQELNPGIQGTYIRVRDEGNAIRLSLKINANESGKIMDQKELDVLVSNFDDTVAILKRSGLTESGFQENYRETWEYENAEIVIDTWPDLPTYIEIEANSEIKLREIVAKLGIEWERKTVVSTDGLYSVYYGISREEALSLLKCCRFDESPFRDLPKWF